jgi:glycosyltransferase involved in cell wall biosynthesis
MRISLYTQHDMRSNTHYGYGKSFIKIQESFRNYNYGGEKLFVDYNNKRANVQMYYGPDPVESAHHSGQYRIHMSQHESTMVVPHKASAYTNDCEEVWTANQWGAQAMINSGVPENKIYVYEHGIDPTSFSQTLRGSGKKIRFLHIDSGSPRKRADLAEKAFNSIYSKYKNKIELTLKYTHFPSSGKDWSNKKVLETAGDWVAPGTRHIRETLSDSEIAELINFHDVLIYPSEGEGFGMIPLEALATGMPVISTQEWCSYSDYLIDNAIESEIKESEISWGYPKVGKAVIAKFDSIVYQMENAIQNIDKISNKYYSQAPQILKEYDWQNKTNSFLNKTISRLGKEIFSVSFEQNNSFSYEQGNTLSDQIRHSHKSKTGNLNFR